MRMENQEQKRAKTIFSFFKKKSGEETSNSSLKPLSLVEASTSVDVPMIPTVVEPQGPQPQTKVSRIPFDENELERDPALRIPIWKHLAYNQDEVRCGYIEWGPNQPILVEYPMTKTRVQNRRFQESWYKKFPWLEYSISIDATFCFTWFVFQGREPLHPAFTIDGFSSWKRVNNGVKCVFLSHMGGLVSTHNNAVRSVEALKNILGHIDKVMNVQSSEEIKKNRLRLKATIDSV